MSRRTSNPGAMLELWRPPTGAGDPIGCLTTTYTFSPGLFDEHCLPRFLDIDADPDREELACFVQRENQLGSIYAGVLIDHTQSGVEHSLRWDILPVRIVGGKQHAKITLLGWSNHVRIIVTSANLSDPGYRTNFEVSATIELSPVGADITLFEETTKFLRRLLDHVCGSLREPPEVLRARRFLDDVEAIVHKWAPSKSKGTVEQRLLFTMPGAGTALSKLSSLEDAINTCRRIGGSPNDVSIASPFFDVDGERSQVMMDLCKSMARGGSRQLTLCVPTIPGETGGVIRILAPRSLLETPKSYQGRVVVRALPDKDTEANRRIWHAKMMQFRNDQYSAMMVGSSNFTTAGMGVGKNPNSEANILTIVRHESYSRGGRQLEEIWPPMRDIDEPEAIEWLGESTERDEEEQANAIAIPQGFLTATYRAGGEQKILFELEPADLPETWTIYGGEKNRDVVADSTGWNASGRKKRLEATWSSPHLPKRLLVQWGENEAFMPVNVEDCQTLPAPSRLENMTAEDMLWIMASPDPSAAVRAWAKQQPQGESWDDELEAALPVDLNPLKRYDLQSTFLHRIRQRARILGHLREQLQRPVWSAQALEWRLRGMIGVEALGLRLVGELKKDEGSTDEKILNLADFLILLDEVDYQGISGALPKSQFDEIYGQFLDGLMAKIKIDLRNHMDEISEDIRIFLGRVEKRCQG